MNKQLTTNVLAIIVSVVGTCSVITPASAGLTTAIKGITKTEVPKITESVTQTTAIAEVGQGVTAAVQETTHTTVGQVAGVATDSTTTAQVQDPSQVQLPSLDDLTKIVQTTGEATVGIQIDQQSTQVDAKADLGVEIANFAEVGICLDANATLGIVNQGSSANCSEAVNTSPEPIETPPVVIQIPPDTDENNSVPEPATLGGLALLGVYFISRRRQVS
ncbi:PEP-CTERM sorting domain-containing protein [Dendronalium sp. ChiSLP03b]|uniref:PEP-CTERM sorting domain-containing protein n=1 Tax=Dendronalium sp. ChiSLP03b TaxID=3075381 RepID=UPI002AD569FD|nr:PEP-CTERM sorting domain-containing protein [Dendronalium sp. ChiSLP03b]MDZ8207016.1 PEP-CTERM sorting domain-containing protein [Dendronalium sp. ChiSLP03b]